METVFDTKFLAWCEEQQWRPLDHINCRCVILKARNMGKTTAAKLEKKFFGLGRELPRASFAFLSFHRGHICPEYNTHGQPPIVCGGKREEVKQKQYRLIRL